MGWGSYRIEIPLLLDEHAGEKERQHTELAAELIREVKTLAESEKYAEIVPYFIPPDIYEE